MATFSAAIGTCIHSMSTLFQAVSTLSGPVCHRMWPAAAGCEALTSAIFKASKSFLIFILRSIASDCRKTNRQSTVSRWQNLLNPSLRLLLWHLHHHCHRCQHLLQCWHQNLCSSELRITGVSLRTDGVKSHHHTKKCVRVCVCVPLTCAILFLSNLLVLHLPIMAEVVTACYRFCRPQADSCPLRLASFATVSPGGLSHGQAACEPASRGGRGGCPL